MPENDADPPRISHKQALLASAGWSELRDSDPDDDAEITARFGQHMPPDLLKISEVAQMARCSTQHVRNLVRRGELPCSRFGKAWRIPRAAVVALLNPTIGEQT